ncbi:hypothetical protein [Mycobacteroides chelonae]|jgi:hypothetical protein|uniref:hypothetical protein n=1 Tax=Mycobacteroides chelonae TaxID=1774 RepID=UPI0010420983|nr:hypothetical protein [Mycobacteroides chelonae]
MPADVHLLPEHNSSCERARLSSCHCYCHGAGHQHDLIKRAVSCTTAGTNNLAQLLDDLRDVYGGFHADFRDVTAKSRRKAPEDLSHLNLERGRGATWVEKMLIDEALHAAFIQVAEVSITLTDAQRKARQAFVVELAEGALRIVGGDVEAQNICDGHLWCSVMAEANDSSSSFTESSPHHGRICYPRNSNVRIPQGVAGVRESGVGHVRGLLQRAATIVGLTTIVHLVGAASCPDLWHHPAGVRYSLQPFVTSQSWPPAGTTNLARSPQFDILENRWNKRGNW